MTKDSYKNVFSDKSRVMVVAAHPDDCEVICGGIVARLRSEGKQVRVVVTTNGGKGCQGNEISEQELAETRIKEQQRAAQALGVEDNHIFNLGYPDGELPNDLGLVEKLVRHIREFKPDLVISHNPDEVINTFSRSDGVYWVNHRDHRHSAIATMDAIYPYSRDRNFFPNQLKEGLEGHEVSHILVSDSYEKPEVLYFDVTDFIDQKRAALSECKSVIPEDHVDEYIDELKRGDRYYEPLALYKLY